MKDKPTDLFRNLPISERRRLIQQSITDLGPFSATWDCVQNADVRALKRALNTARNEGAMQRFLESQPWLLIQSLGSGHERWVIPKKRFGSEYITDFMIGGRQSDGFYWCAVELESPCRPMFNKSGDPSRYLVHALRQIADWRSWLENNQNYAARARSEGGLGLVGVSPRLSGLIIIDRRQNVNQSTNDLRKRLSYDHRVEIRTYDFLLDSLVARVAAIGGSARMRQRRRVGRTS